MIGKTHILRSADGSVPALTTDEFWPDVPVDLASAHELVWQVAPLSTTGSPSSFAITATFQYALDSISNFQYTTAKWFDVPTINLATDLAEGEGFAQFTSIDQYQKRTMRGHPRLVRLKLSPSFVGGTNPGVRVAVLLTARGY